MRYAIAEPNSYLVITGAGVDGVRIEKKAFVWPMQKVTKISITPFDFSIDLVAMTKEKLKFSLPAVFTVGPHDEIESMKKYAVLLTGESDGTPITVSRKGTVPTGRNHVADIVRGIIEGETRGIVSTMSMEELFRERAVFKRKVIENVQSELNQFGLTVYNANVKELQDSNGSDYFQTLSRKAHEGAINQAKVDVAEARAHGEVGAAEKEGRAKQEIAKINANTSILETERKSEKAVADAKLVSKTIEIERELQLERIAAKRAGEQRDVQLQRELELKRAEMELERQRAETVVKAKIDREAQSEKAQAELYRKTQDAEAVLIARTKEAEAQLVQRKADADATLLTRKAEADGMKELADGYRELSDVLGGPAGLMHYIMIKEGTYERLAASNAKAVNGMQPKINVWTTGQGDAANDSAAPLRNLFQTLPPLFSGISEQTGMTPPNWLMQMPQDQKPQTSQSQAVQQTKPVINGHK